MYDHFLWGLGLVGSLSRHSTGTPALHSFALYALKRLTRKCTHWAVHAILFSFIFFSAHLFTCWLSPLMLLTNRREHMHYAEKQFMATAAFIYRLALHCPSMVYIFIFFPLSTAVAVVAAPLLILCSQSFIFCFLPFHLNIAPCIRCALFTHTHST